MKTIVKIIKRHSWGCFTVEDSDGNWFRVQSAYILEEIYTRRNQSA